MTWDFQKSRQCDSAMILLNPKPKSVGLMVPCHAEEALCGVCLPPFSTEERANGAFFFFQWQQRSCFNVISLFSCARVAPERRPDCQTAGIPCLGRWCTADSGIASIAGGVATCPPISALFEVTKPDIKGYRGWAALMNCRFHDFFTFVMALSWQRHQSFWVENRKEDLRDSFSIVLPVHILPWITA